MQQSFLVELAALQHAASGLELEQADRMRMEQVVRSTCLASEVQQDLEVVAASMVEAQLTIRQVACFGGRPLEFDCEIMN